MTTEIAEMVVRMRKYQLVVLIYLGFINVSYAGSQLTVTDCESLYSTESTYWYYSPISPSSELGAQCALFNYYTTDCPTGKHQECCLTIAGTNKTPDTDYLGGVSNRKGWLLYKQYSTKAELFKDANKGGALRQAYEKCMSE